jgi:hypothetical protein
MKIIGDNCKKCDGDLGDRYAVVGHNRDTSYMLCGSCWPPLKEQLDITQNIIVKNFIQPERSKREDFLCIKCAIVFYIKTLDKKMRCSELHGNMERDK